MRLHKRVWQGKLGHGDARNRLVPAFLPAAASRSLGLPSWAPRLRRPGCDFRRSVVLPVSESPAPKTASDAVAGAIRIPGAGSRIAKRADGVRRWRPRNQFPGSRCATPSSEGCSSGKLVSAKPRRARSCAAPPLQDSIGLLQGLGGARRCEEPARSCLSAGGCKPQPRFAKPHHAAGIRLACSCGLPAGAWSRFERSRAPRSIATRRWPQWRRTSHRVLSRARLAK